MPASTVDVVIDDRVRLLAALLALTTWPLQEQAAKPHGVHAHAKATQAKLKPLEGHPAVDVLQTIIESYTLDAVFSLAGHFTWPGFDPIDAPGWPPEGWLEKLENFALKSELTDWWDSEPLGEWQKAEQAAQAAFHEGDPRDMLMRFFGGLAEVNYAFHPNLAYPTAQSVGYWVGETLVAVVPPHVAWGTNPPWPYDQDEAATHRAAITVYIRQMLVDFFATYPEAVQQAQDEHMPVPNTFRSLYPTWEEQITVLLTTGITALYLRETFNTAEEKAFVVMERKEHAYKDIHHVITVLERFLTLRSEGKYATFGDYLPTFQKALRIEQGLDKA